MTAARSIPDSLRHRPFSTRQALDLGLSESCLRGRRFRRLFRGVYVVASVEMTLVLWVMAGLLALPADAIASHLTALRIYGLDVGRDSSLHFSTNGATYSRLKGVVTHRRRGRMTPNFDREVPLTGPDRTLVDIATKVSLVELIQAADWMIHQKLTTLEALTEYAMARHLDGVLRMRRALAYVREGAESPMETLIRLMIVFSRLPEPKCNKKILDASGRSLARGDLIYFRWKVLVEYDGIHHERDPRQRQKDRERRETLEANGWRVIVITAEDLRDKGKIVWRVFVALKARGYAGAPPHTNAMWTKWFA